MRYEETRGTCRCHEHRGKRTLSELHLKAEDDADVEWLEELAEIVKKRAIAAGSAGMASEAAIVQQRLRRFKAAQNN